MHLQINDRQVSSNLHLQVFLYLLLQVIIRVIRAVEIVLSNAGIYVQQ